MTTSETISNNASKIITRIIISVVAIVGFVVVTAMFQLEMSEMVVGVFASAITGLFAFGGNIVSLLRPPAAQTPSPEMLDAMRSVMREEIDLRLKDMNGEIKPDA